MQVLERVYYTNHDSSQRRIPRQAENGQKGTLIIIGGRAEEASLQAVPDHIVPPKHLTITTLASKDPEYQYEKCKDPFTRFSIEVSHLTAEDIAEDKEGYLSPETSGVYVTGGMQNLLMERLQQSRFGQELMEYYARGGTVIGTSAGASFMGEVMPVEDTYAEGFGFVPHIIDQHFSNRNRKGRLKALVQQFPEKLGIGVDENTAVIYRNNQMQIMGEGQVYLLASTGRASTEEIVLSHGQVFDLGSFSSSPDIAAG